MEGEIFFTINTILKLSGGILCLEKMLDIWLETNRTISIAIYYICMTIYKCGGGLVTKSCLPLRSSLIVAC